MANPTIRMPSPGDPSVDPYRCYIVPSGVVGLINDLVSIYIFVCLVGGRTPLRPKRRLQNRRWTVQFCFLCVGQVTVHNIVIARSCLRQSGSARALIWITLAKIVLLPLVGMFVAGIALHHIASNGGGRGEDGGEDMVDTQAGTEASSKVGPVFAAATPTPGQKGQYRDATIEAGSGGPHGYGPLELENLPEHTTADSQAMTSEASELGTTDTKIYITAGDHEGIDGSAPVRTPSYLESQFDENQEVGSGEASESLLPDVENANDRPRWGFRRVATLTAMLLISGSPAVFLAAHISMAIQSIKDGNRNTLVVGFVFFILFLAGITAPLLFGPRNVLMAGRRPTPYLSKPFMLVPLWAAFILAYCLFPYCFSVLLVILYGDMNLGVMSDRVMGLGPTTNGFAMALYWIYLVSTKLALFCF
jgi:hypothetical protein